MNNVINKLTEAIDPKAALELKKESKSPIIFYGWQYKNDTPVDIIPEEHTEESFEARKRRVVNDYNKLNADKPRSGYAKENEFMFYVLYNRLDEAKRKERQGIDSINYNAGNVEHNIAMFNKMNNPIGNPSTNPVSGPMGESLTEGLIEDEAKMYILELVLSEYETGHQLVDDYVQFARLLEEDGLMADDSMWNLYVECHDLGPVGFYEEYKDILDFSDEFKSEYAYEEEIEDNSLESFNGFKIYDKVHVKPFNFNGQIINLIKVPSGKVVAEVRRDRKDGYFDPYRFYLDELELLTESIDEEDFEIIEESLNESDDEVENDKIYQVRQIDDKGNELDQFLEFDSKEEAINKAKTINTPVEVKEMTKSMKESIGSDEKVIWTNLNIEEDLDEGMSREAMIAELKRVGKNYNFDRFSDAQLYRMYEKDVFLKPEAPKRPSRKSMMINPYENTCEECGALLNDMGDCPRCVHGEEDMDESLLTEGPKDWLKAIKAKKAAKTDPAKADELATAEKLKEQDKIIKNLGKLLAPMYTNNYENYRFLLDDKIYTQDEYKKQVPSASLKILGTDILTLDPSSKEMVDLAKAIDTVVINPNGYLVRRGLEVLPKDKIPYIRGRDDILNIPENKSSKAIFERSIFSSGDKEDSSVDTASTVDASVTTDTTSASIPTDTTVDSKERIEDETTPVTATSGDKDYINPDSIKVTSTLLAKRKGGSAIYYTKDGKIVSYKDITPENASSIYLDKEGKVSFADALKQMKDKMKQRKAQITKQAALFGEDMDMENKEVLTEAPIITLNDKDIMNPGNIDFRRKIADAQAEEDAIKAEEKAEEERAIYRRKYGKATSVLEDGLKNGKSSENILEDLNSILVPARDECDTVGGEICRAMMRILYRWYNDGDRFYQGYGLETAGSSASYLANHIESIEKLISHLLEDYDYSYDEDNKYEQFIKEMTDDVIDYLRNNEKVMFTPNIEDSRDWDTSYLEENQPTYEYELPSSDDIRTLVDNQVLTAWDLNDYVDDWMGWNTIYEGASCSRPWSHYSAEVTVVDLTREGLTKLEQTFRKNGRFSEEAVEEFWQELVDEHRDELESEYDYEDSYDEESDYDTDIDTDDDI